MEVVINVTDQGGLSYILEYFEEIRKESFGYLRNGKRMEKGKKGL